MVVSRVGMEASNRALKNFLPTCSSLHVIGGESGQAHKAPEERALHVGAGVALWYTACLACQHALSPKSHHQHHKQQQKGGLVTHS